MEGRLGGLDAVAKRKIPYPDQESNLGPPARSLFTILPELPLFPTNCTAMYTLPSVM
jgi:hypothetical protein